MTLPSGLSRLVSDFKKSEHENPSGDVIAFEFQQLLVGSGEFHDYSQAQLAEAAQRIGIPREEISDFMDSLASWL